MRINLQVLFWRWTIYIPMRVVRSVETSLGCSIIARLGLLALGIFCIDVPQRWLTPENLPARSDYLAVLGIGLHYVGVVIVIIALISLLLNGIALVKYLRSLF